MFEGSVNIKRRMTPTFTLTFMTAIHTAFSLRTRYLTLHQRTKSVCVLFYESISTILKTVSWFVGWLWLQKPMPWRLKGFHYYNAGTIFEALMVLIRPVLSKKLQNRVRFCNLI